MMKQILIVLGILLVFGCGLFPSEDSTSTDTTPTDTTAPTISSTSPSSGANSVSISSNISINFSEEMDSSTINSTNITVADNNGNAVGGVVSYNNNFAIFNPSTDLNFSTTYAITVSTGVKDSAGNALASSYNWNFTSANAAPKAIATGYQDNCALFDNNTIRCWGNNDAGQLGDGTTDDRATPITVSGISSATAITLGGASTCTLLDNQSVMCWGSNSLGRLGDNTTTNRTTPVSVVGISTAIDVGTGKVTCIVLADKSIKCAGRNNQFGMLGIGSMNGDPNPVPVSVSGISTARSVHVGGGDSVCAILDNKTMECWGRNTYGTLGDNTTTDRYAPVSVSGISNATAAVIGGVHTCALLDDGRIMCWGANSYGQLGDGTNNNSSVPVFVSGISNATAISESSRSHTCALLDDGRIMCWGYNAKG